MLASSTVENYLKAIHLAQSRLDGARALVPMGQLSTALGVVPGTATSMVKALADAGLVSYEPYSGVRLTPAGEKLAAAVLRQQQVQSLPNRLEGHRAQHRLPVDPRSYRAPLGAARDDGALQGGTSRRGNGD